MHSVRLGKSYSENPMRETQKIRNTASAGRSRRFLPLPAAGKSKTANGFDSRNREVSTSNEREFLRRYEIRPEETSVVAIFSHEGVL